MVLLVLLNKLAYALVVYKKDEVSTAGSLNHELFILLNSADSWIWIPLLPLYTLFLFLKTLKSHFFVLPLLLSKATGFMDDPLSSA